MWVLRGGGLDGERGRVGLVANQVYFDVASDQQEDSWGVHGG